MISVCVLNPGSEQVVEFRAWVEAEWGTIDPFDEQDGKVLPAPILALEDGALVGGLTFTYSSIPGAQESALWINTLLVAPRYRLMGIGSKLIAFAESCVGKSGVDQLYVFTEIAPIYQKRGWHIHGSAGTGAVLRRQIVSDQEQL